MTQTRTRTSDTDVKRVPSFFGVVIAGIVLALAVEAIEGMSKGAGWLLAVIIVFVMLMQYPRVIDQATGIITRLTRGEAQL